MSLLYVVSLINGITFNPSLVIIKNLEKDTSLFPYTFYWSTVYPIYLFHRFQPDLVDHLKAHTHSHPHVDQGAPAYTCRYALE